MALVEQLGDDNWSVVWAACCHMALLFAIMRLCNSFYFALASVRSSFFILEVNGAYIGITPFVCPSIRPAVCPSVHVSDFVRTISPEPLNRFEPNLV